MGGVFRFPTTSAFLHFLIHILLGPFLSLSFPFRSCENINRVFPRPQVYLGRKFNGPCVGTRAETVVTSTCSKDQMHLSASGDGGQGRRLLCGGDQKPKQKSGLERMGLRIPGFYTLFPPSLHLKTFISFLC